MRQPPSRRALPSPSRTPHPPTNLLTQRNRRHNKLQCRKMRLQQLPSFACWRDEERELNMGHVVREEGVNFGEGGVC